MSDSASPGPKSIRLDHEAHHAAKVAAVSSRKTLGRWLQEAIQEKIAREGRKGRKGDRK